MKVVVVGAGGNIGSRLVRELCDRGHEVRGIFRNEKSADRVGDYDFDVFVADIMDENDLRGAFDGYDVCYHLVGYLFAPRKSQIEDINMAAARNVSKACLESGVKRIVFTSSILVYGPDAIMPSKEETRRNPDTAYSKAKVKVEDHLLALESSGISITILRVGHVYGPDVSTVEEFKCLMRKNLYRTAGRADHHIPPIHVEDLANGLALAGESERAKNEIFNISDDEKVTLQEFCDLIASGLGKRPFKSAPVWFFNMSAVFLEALSALTNRRPFFDRDTVVLMREEHYGDNSKIKNVLGWEPKYRSVYEGIDTCFD